AFWGTYLGYVIANIWFYALGATMILALAADDLIAAFLAIPAAWLALLIILVDETDNTFADIYSAAVSSQNIFSTLRQRWGALAIGAVCFILAATFDIRQYENFLLLIGSVFVSLFGVLAADYFVLRRRYETQDIYRAGGQYWYWLGFHWRGILAWALGIALYQIIANFVPWLGASIPSFLLAFLAYLALAQVARQPAPAAA
ncbi:MAG: cytosine permease, partial [Chloroflexi bacterium]|nr:cytosine permease [Chloroflexota bacterium]